MDAHFSFISERCPWANIPSKNTTMTMITCNAVSRRCCQKNCAPLHFIQNGVGRIIADDIQTKGRIGKIIYDKLSNNDKTYLEGRA